MSERGFEDLMSEEEPKGKKESQAHITKETVITVLSGAGISEESGIPTFRGADGLWNSEQLAKLATPRGFAEDPERGWRFYNERRQNMAKAQPNAAHQCLADFEEQDYDIVVITQNIDRLHQRAGSTKVVELHGSVWDLKCSNPSCTSKPFENTDLPIKEIPPVCERCGAWLRPDVVFFEEPLDPLDIQAADSRTKATEIFLIVGTSGVVYPAAGFAHIAKAFGAYVLEFNRELTPLSSICDRSVLGPCGETLPATLAELIGGDVPSQ